MIKTDEIASYIEHYNTYRPHASLNDATPEEIYNQEMQKAQLEVRHALSRGGEEHQPQQELCNTTNLKGVVVEKLGPLTSLLLFGLHPGSLLDMADAAIRSL